MDVQHYQAECDYRVHTRGSVSLYFYMNTELTQFTIPGNGMSEALTLALYFLICRETGEFPRFPGNQFFYTCPDDNSYAPSLADLSVWATTTPAAANEAFNHVNGDTFVWRYFFPKIGSYFGLEVG